MNMSIRNKSLFFTITLGLLILSQCLYPHQNEASINHGPYEVGVKFLESIDYSRSFGKKQGRPLKGILWYPGEGVGRSKIKMSDYFLKSKSGLEGWKEYFGQMNQASIFESVSTWEPGAFLDMIPSSVNLFPVIIYSPGGFGDEFENAIICELLASHGFIVAAHYSLGPNASATKINAEGLESQARDIEWMIGLVKRDFPKADLDKLGLMGWSWGGLASMLVQARNANIDAVVSLDGSMALHADKILSIPYFSPQKVNVPYLFTSAKRTSQELKQFLQPVKYSESILVEYPFLNHEDFSSLAYLSKVFKEGQLNEEEEQSKGSYDGLTRTVVEFFDLNLKGLENGGLHRTLESQNAQGITNYEGLKSLPNPPATEDFFEMVVSNDISKWSAVFDSVTHRDKAYRLFYADEAIELAYELHYDRQMADKAQALLKLSLRSYPGHYQTHGHLGNLLYKSGRLKEALEYFSRALGMIATESSKASGLDRAWYQRSIDRIKSKMD